MNRFFEKICNNIQNTVDSEKAEKAKKRLIIIGTIIAVIGFGGTFACFVGFTLTGRKAIESGDMGLFLFCFLAFVPSFFIGGVGANAASIGIKIKIAQVTADVIDTNTYCPKCGDVITENEMYCSKCGEPLLKNKICSCGHQNDIDSTYCTACGKKL